MPIRNAALVVAACGIAAVASAQDNVMAAKATIERDQLAVRAPFEKTVKGAPYSAETIVQATQTLADGTHINRKTTGRIYRDGEGRTRREEDNTPAAGAVSVRTAGGQTVSGIVREGHTRISIVDPVAGYSYSLDPENKVAWRTPLAAFRTILDKVAAEERSLVAAKRVEEPGPPPPPPPPAAGGFAGSGGFAGGAMIARSGAKSDTTTLEHSTIDGLTVEGHHSTSTIAAGLVGNDQPITITSEEWTSPDLQVLVLTRHSDPRSGEQTYKLTNVVRAEPDQSLFMVPPDYSVKDTGIRRLEPGRKYASRHATAGVSGDVQCTLAMAQRKIDVVLDSVRRLIRIGATANLVNLLQKQHPADLAQVLSELGERDRVGAFALLIERNSKLAMEALSELDPEGAAALIADRPPEEIARLLHDLPSDDAAALIDKLPEELSAAVVALIEKHPGDEVGELLEYEEQTAGRIMNPKVFALSEDMTAGEAITTLQGSRDVEMVFYLYVVDARRHLVGVVSLRRLLLVPPATPLKRIMTTD